jgi:hypothetical protein
MSQRRPGFSMTGLLVLLALLLFFLALLFPALHQVRRAAARSQGMNNLRQLALGVHNYHDINNGMPPAVGTHRGVAGTVHFHLLPFIEQTPLHQKGKEDLTNVMDQPVSLFVDPADPRGPGVGLVKGFALTNYPANWKVLLDGGVNLGGLADGTSNTILFAQRYQVCNGAPTAWAYNRLHYWAPLYGFYSSARFQVMPSDDRCDPALPQALSGTGLVTCFADGSVRVASAHCSPQSWLAATEPADGKTADNDFE